MVDGDGDRHGVSAHVASGYHWRPCSLDVQIPLFQFHPQAQIFPSVMGPFSCPCWRFTHPSNPEIPAQIFGCVFLSVVMCCFCPFLHCIPSVALLDWTWKISKENDDTDGVL